MKISKRFELAETVAMPAGTLCVLEFQAKAVKAISLGPVSGSNAVPMILLDKDGETGPVVTEVPQKMALSYGTDWVLDVGEGEGVDLDAGTPPLLHGGLRMGPDLAVLKVRRLDGRMPSEFVFVDLVANRPHGGVSFPDRTFDVATWRIWLSEAEQAREGGRPVFEFTATARG